MKKLQKLSLVVLASVTFGTAGVGATTATTQANASILGKVTAATYIYKNRNTIREMVSAAKSKAGVVGFPKFKQGAANGSTSDVYVVTKHHKVDLGAYPTSVVRAVANADSKTKAEITKYI